METREKYTPSHIANYFLWRAWREGIKDMTTMKLIKLVYVAYGWNLVMNNNNKQLFEEPILAWEYGPVIPSLYHEFKRFGNRSIPKGSYSTIADVETGELSSAPMINNKDSEVLRILNAEWNHYKNLDGIELSNITHQSEDGPWKKAWKQGKNTKLDDGDIAKRSIAAINQIIEKSNLN